jgi:hypothetical protein
MTCTHFCLSFTLLLSGNAALAQRVPIAQQLVFTPYRSTGIYEVGETVGWTVGPGRVTPTYAYKWTIRRNNAVVLKEGKLDLSSGKDKIEITGDQPEMIYGDCACSDCLSGQAAILLSATRRSRPGKIFKSGVTLEYAAERHTAACVPHGDFSGNTLANEYSKSLVKKVRTWTRAVLDEAAEQEFIGKIRH